MRLTLDNIVEKIKQAFYENNNKLIAKVAYFVSQHMADVVRLSNWKTLSPEIRLNLLEQSILFNDEVEDSGSDDEDQGGNSGSEPKLDIYTQKDGHRVTGMALKNNGNCRVACQIVSQFRGVTGDILRKMRILDVGESWMLDEEAIIMITNNNDVKFVAQYVAAPATASDAAIEDLLKIEALVKKLELTW